MFPSPSPSPTRVRTKRALVPPTSATRTTSGWDWRFGFFFFRRRRRGEFWSRSKERKKKAWKSINRSLSLVLSPVEQDSRRVSTCRRPWTERRCFLQGRRSKEKRGARGGETKTKTTTKTEESISCEHRGAPSATTTMGPTTKLLLPQAARAAAAGPPPAPQRALSRPPSPASWKKESEAGPKKTKRKREEEKKRMSFAKTIEPRRRRRRRFHSLALELTFDSLNRLHRRVSKKRWCETLVRSPMEPFFPRGTPEHDEDDEQQHAADARARLIRARSSSGAGPREASPLSSSTMFDSRRRLFLSPRSLAVGVVAASLRVYACAVLMVSTSVRF